MTHYSINAVPKSGHAEMHVSVSTSENAPENVSTPENAAATVSADDKDGNPAANMGFVPPGDVGPPPPFRGVVTPV